MMRSLGITAVTCGIGLGAVLVFLACGSASGGGPVSVIPCVASGLDRDSGTSCSACIESTCGSPVGQFQSACADYLACVCPSGSAVDPSREPACAPKLADSGCTGTIDPLQSCEQAHCAKECMLSTVDNDAGSVMPAEAGSGVTFSCTNGTGASLECDQQDVPDAAVATAQMGCTQVGGTAGAGCSVMGLAGCCRQGTIEACYYDATSAPSRHTACTAAGGAWSTSF